MVDRGGVPEPVTDQRSPGVHAADGRELRTWIGKPPSNARCPHPACHAGARGEVMRGDLEVVEPCIEYVIGTAASLAGGGGPNPFGIVDVGARVYVFDPPKGIDGTRGRGLSRAEALVLAAYLVDAIPNGRAGLDEALATLARARR